jgi:hypothetical protein
MTWLIICLLMSGCNAKPSEEDARASYQSHKKTLQGIETEIKDALAGFPYAGPRYSCADPGQQHADMKCLNAYQAWLKSTLQAERTFRTRMATAWLDAGVVKGLEVVITRTLPLRPKTMGEAALAPKQQPQKWIFGCGSKWRANRHGSTVPKDGFRVDGRQVGWGHGQLSFDAGKGKKYSDEGKYFRQLDVVWDFKYKAVAVTVEANILSREQTPEPWQRARKATCERDGSH